MGSRLRGESPRTAPRIAVAGAGLAGRRHIELVRAGHGYALAAVVDPALQARDQARNLRVPWFPSLGDLLAADRPDGVIIATPNHLHVRHGLACVRAGVPALVEKPVAETVEDALVLVEAAEAAAVPLLVGHHRRHSPLLVRARETVRSGQLGEIVAVSGSALYHKPDEYFEQGPWRRETGGGPILINVIHEVDGLRFLCGDIESVFAATSNKIRGFDVEDTVAVTLRFSAGPLGTFLLSDAAVSTKSWEQTSGENPSYPHDPDEDCYVIAGTRGSLSVPTMRLRRQTGRPSWWRATVDTVLPVGSADPLAVQLRHFRDVVTGAADPLVSARDATLSLRVVRAIAASASSGHSVRCDPSCLHVPAPDIPKGPL